MVATSFDRKYLDKNGCNRLKQMQDYAWAGTAALGTSALWNNVNYGTGTVGSWSVPMKQKFTPKTIKRRGWRD